MSARDVGQRRPYRGDRRADAAAQTRARIVESALRLFVEHGYGKVTISDIAREAGTSVPTVYAGTGGKSAILAALMARGVEDPAVEESMTAVQAATDPREAIRAMVHGVRSDNERHLDIVRVMITAAAVDRGVETAYHDIVGAYRQALGVLPGRLEELGELRPGLTRERATDMLWFFLGLHAWPLLVAEHGWSWDEAEDWLVAQLASALLVL